MRKSDIAKFGTRAERNTDIWQYAQRLPLPYEKTTEEKISQHMKDRKKKYRGEIKIRHRPAQSDAAFGVSSAKSNISKAMSSRKPKKPQAGGKCSRKSSQSALNTSNVSSVAASLAASSSTSPTTSKSKRIRRAPYYFGFESSVYSVSDDSAAPAPKRSRTANPVIETIIQEEASQPPVVETLIELPIVSPPAPPPVGTWSPDNYEYEDYAREGSMSVFDAENQI